VDLLRLARAAQTTFSVGLVSISRALMAQTAWAQTRCKFANDLQPVGSQLSAPATLSEQGVNGPRPVKLPNIRNAGATSLSDGTRQFLVGAP